MKIIDAHTHVYNLNENFEPLYKLGKRLNYESLNVLSLQCTGNLLQNLTCALCKITHTDIPTYAFGGLDYKTGRDFLTQAKNMRAMGFDGIKMLEGKPTVRKFLNTALDDAIYDDYYSYMEETGFPILFHIVDPPEFWDREKVPDWAYANGWFYDETYTPYGQYYDEVDNMLNKHPKLKGIFAHFYFLSGDPDRAQKFLDDHPSVAIDFTAGIEMYENFSKDPDFWHDFFVKNKDRLIFGTDSSDSDNLSDEGDTADGKVALNGYAAMEIEFLKYKKEIEVFDKKINGVGLPHDALELIFASNFEGFVGKTPKPMNVDLLIQEANFIRGYLKSDDIKTLDYIIKQINL
jgi:hypothetical protein